MRSFVLSALGVCSVVVAQSSTIDSYISTESPIARSGLLANIGANGNKSANAKAGVVIASPSTVNPDYLFTWVRDSSLVFRTIIDQYTLGQDNDTSLRSLIDDFVSAEGILQNVTNPSGNISSGGLGEPKFMIDETAFTGSWGRPQRDGPALRSTALITYANWLIADSNVSYVNDTLWPIIQLDLDYVASDWNQSTFDLWEEVSSSSFFTTAVQHTALRAGSTLATALNITSVVKTYDKQADNILCFLQSYWNPTGSYITSNTGGGRSGIDANSALASIHTFDASAGCDAVTFQPCSDKALSSLKVYVDSFRDIYEVNNGTAVNASVATGRYPEDVYMGGNPWYLTTAAVAEQLYDALIVWKAEGALNVTDISLSFFQQFNSTLTNGTYDNSTSTFTNLISDIKDFADGFLAVNAKYTPANGSLSEQFDRTVGTPLSATDLTWSYASTLTAFGARNGTIPASWGAANLTVPKTCLTNYGPTSNVTFSVNATTVMGESIYITGSIAQLQNWSPNTTLLMTSTKSPTWKITLELPADTNIEYKYIRKRNGVITWEADPNNHLTTLPAGKAGVIHEVWR